MQVRSSVWTGALCLILVSSLPTRVWAQSDAASLTVTVSDSSGQRVPGAAVTLRRLSTGVVRELTSSSEGVALFSLLAPDLYDLTVTLEGFRQFHDSAVRLQVAQPAALDVTLEVGPIAESLDVTATVSLLNVTTAAQGTVIGEAQIEALPLNGRQFIQLALLVPGSNPGGRAVQQNTIRQNQIGGLSVAGGRTNNTAFLLDGAVNTDPDYNSLNYSPSIDAIAEFQVQTAQFSADYGRAGAQVNVVTKSGGQTFRGSAFEFDRNKAFDSKPFNLAGDLPKFNRDNFGGTLGGPLVPGRVFFFGAYEQLRRREAASSLTTVTVPTALERQGDFSQSPGSIYDPSHNRQQFPGNKIPTERLNPLALAAVNALPLPNVGDRSYVNSAELLQQDSYNPSGRIDVNAGSGNVIFTRWSYTRENSIIPDVVPGRDTLGNARPQNVVVGWTRVLGPRAVNEFRAGLNQLNLLSGLPELQFTVNGQQTAIPRFLVNGFLNGSGMGGAGAFTGTTGGGIVNVSNRTYQVYDNWTWDRERHHVKIGGEFLWVQYNRNELPSSLGTFTFTAGYTSRTTKNDGTGNSLASFLIGQPQQGSRAVGPSIIAGRQPVVSTYVQDDWRLSDRLTLNLGLRYELTPPMYDANGGMASIDYSNVPTPQQIFAQSKLAFYTPTVFVCGQSGYPRGCAYTDKDDFAPRLSLVWRANDRTVVRGGGGIYYDANDANPLFRLAAGIPDNIAQTVSFDNFTPQRGPGLDIFGPAILGPVQVQQAGIDLHQENGQSTEFSVGVEREFARDWVVEASYVGSRSKYLEQNVQPNNAQPGLGPVDPRRPYGALVFAAGTVFPDYVVVQGTSVPVGFINYLSHTASANYDALLTRVEKRLSHGISFLSSYTLSRARSNAPQFRNAGGVNGAENSPPQDSFNLGAEWGPAYYDARHRWVTNVTVPLPYGFQAAGIYTMQSGFPFTINLKGDTAGVGAGTGGIFVRPNVVPGVDPYLPKSAWDQGLYLTKDAFTAPPAGAFGNTGRNSIVGPGYIDLDLAISRSFSFGSARRLDLRVEAFNLTNRRNYTLVGRILNDPTFGQLLSQSDPRQWQFGARFVF
jgi:hypothetical protein